MRRSVLIALVLCFAASTFVLAHHAPEKIAINAAQKKQPPVQFDHEKHSMTLVKACDKCHHTQKGLTAAKVKEMKVAKCSSCHLDPKPNVPSMREMSLTKNPFHMACIACHKEQKKGPTACTACHKKG